MDGGRIGTGLGSGFVNLVDLRHTCCCLLLSCATAWAAVGPLTAASRQNSSAPPGERVTQAVRTNGRIVIDGILSEPEWQDAVVATDFIQRIPDTGKPATERTEVRLLYDDAHLYVGVHCFDSAGRAGIVVNDITKDFYTLDSDGFQIVLDTYNDDRNSFLFGTNPAAGRFDMQIGADGNAGNTSWDGIWDVATSIDDQGWHVEMSIPFKTLRFSGESEQVWGVNFERRVRRKFEDSYWSPLGAPYRLGRVSLAGRLEGLRGVEPGRNLWVKPYVSAPIVRREGDDTDFLPDAGVDVKYGLSSQLTLDITTNTDFSQVEADDEQINLTRFSLFFPEKRDFFLENAGIFEWGRRRRGSSQQNDVIPFFSRRIGLTEDGAVVPILGGVRVSGRTGPYSLGLLSIQTDDTELEPSTNFSLIRVRRDILRQSDVGALFINKDGGEGFNRTYGVDSNFNFFRYMDLSLWAVETDGPGTDGRDGAVNFELNWWDQFYDIRASHLRIGEDFNPEVGFAPRVGIHKTSAKFGITPRPRERIPWIREINPAVEFDYITNEDNQLETRVGEAGVKVTFSDSSYLQVEGETNFERLDEPFEIRDGQFIAAGDYRFDEFSVEYSSDRSRLLSWQARVGTGGFYDGDRDDYRVGLALQPSHRLSTRLQWSHNDLNLPSGDFRTNLVAGRVDYSFSNRMFLHALIQYNSEADEIVSNVRFNFMHRPLSDFYLVYNERRNSDGDVKDRALIAKLTYLFAF